MADPVTLTTPATGQSVVLYDGQCPLCQRSVKILRRLDWFKVLRFQDARDVEHLPASAVPLDPDQLLKEMHLLTPDRRRVYAGFYAFRYIAWRIPALLVLAPWLYLPGVPTLGQKVYRWVAKNRFGLVSCHDGQCAVPPHRARPNK
jgi:predicted DCC family thiol-disulfide oxidoreductase YuxK